MNIMKASILLVFLLSTLPIIAQNSRELPQWIIKVLKTELEVSHQHKGISKKFLKFVKGSEGEKFDIVDRGEEYNNTDFKFYKNKPFRSLMFYAYSNNKSSGVVL